MKNDIIDNNNIILGKESSQNINELNKNYDISTTKEDDSFIAEEAIQYCSSPKTGLVSINVSNDANKKFTLIPSEKNIINTIMMKISMLKDTKRQKHRSTTVYKTETFFKKDELFFSRRDNQGKLIFTENKKNECRGSVKIKKLLNTPIMALGRGNLHPLNKDINKSLIKKKLSQNKKKKKGKKEEKCEEKDKDNNKKRKNKKIKKNKKERLSQKKIKSDLLKEENDKILKERDNATNVIFFDYSSSIENKEESDDSINNVSININDNKSFIHNELISVNNIDNKAEDDTNGEFFRKQKTAVIDYKSYELNKKKDLPQEKKIVRPKAKQSCHMDCSHNMNMNLFFQLSNRKLTSNNLALENQARIKPRSKPISSNNLNKDKDKKNNEKEKDKKDSNNIIKLFNPKNIFNRKSDGEKQNKVPPRHSFWKNINRSTENIKSKNTHKMSHQSYKFILQKNKFENYEKNAKNKINTKKEEISYLHKSNKNLSIKELNKIKTKIRKSDSYRSNNNLAKIAINPLTAENKDIHLVLDGKQETIINYTNQEMVDDENEYLVQCLKVLLKLKMEQQPRCKTKVNFNFPPQEAKKKIALFDLDETLVHCTKDQKGLNGDEVNVKLPTNKTVTIGLNIRSHWKEALDLIKAHYNIVVYTASHQSYADAVLNYLDKENKYFQYRLYRNHCVQCDVDGIKFYVKDLDTLNKHYNLKDVVLIDNSVLSFAYHLSNGIPIVPFIEQKDDTQLLMLAYYLVSIAGFDDLTVENKKHINLEHYLQEAEKLPEEESEEDDTINEEESKDANNIKEENINDDNKTKENNEIKKEERKAEKDKKRSTQRRKSKKLLSKRSEKKLAENMKKDMDDIYKSNYN
jgi:Dullard-like phosphatase family protein